MKSKKERRENGRAQCSSVKGSLLLLWIRASRVPLAAKPKRAILITI
jgi:hypothetical protein